MVWNQEVNSVQNLERKLRHTSQWAEFCGLERDTQTVGYRADSLPCVVFTCGTKGRIQMGWSTLLQFIANLSVKMNSNSKSVNSSAIKAEIKRHESVQSAINRLFKQFERVGDQQLRSGLKVYLHSIQGKLLLYCHAIVHVHGALFFAFIEYRKKATHL